MMKRLFSATRLFGIDPPKTVASLRGLGVYRRNRADLSRQLQADAALGRAFPMGKSYPCLVDRYQESGVAMGHYFHQDLYVAQLVYEAKPRRHMDVGSRVDGFVAHVASFREIEAFDIRDLRTSARNITFRQRDIMEPRPDLDGCTDSLSCLHTLEHFGLGRYGDPVRADGHLVGFENLARMVAAGGVFYFSTVIGPQRIEFDAHRVFAVPYLVEMCEKHFEIRSLAYVNDAGELIRGADWKGAEAQRSFGCRYGCAIFTLVKRG